MGHFEFYLALMAVIALVGIVFGRTSAPSSLVLLLAGMLLSVTHFFPPHDLHPKIILDIFLPMLIYGISAETSWRDIKVNLRPIALLSFGHVIFITLVVAWTIHTLIPSLGWPLAFVLGAVISPPDDVAIVPIAETGILPQRIVVILKSEAMFNDATALILFRFSLAALITHQFSLMEASWSLLMIIVGETLYGLCLGYLIGTIRLKIIDSKIHMIISFITPFLAYLPAEKLGGSGILATAVAGLVLGHRFYDKFRPEVRLIARSLWSTLSFGIQSILFLLVGLNLRAVLERISSIPMSTLMLYSAVVIAVVVVGRFVWVFPSAYLPRFLFRSIREKDPYPPWQYPFIISWAGMRGSISLAAVLAIPPLSQTVNGANARDLLIFLVFSVIIATLLIQGLSLPWLVKLLGVQTYRNKEKLKEHQNELSARIKIVEAVLKWLKENVIIEQQDSLLTEEIKNRMREYKVLKKQLKNRLKTYQGEENNDDLSPLESAVLLSAEILQIERSELARLWHENKIPHAIRNKLQQELDHRSKLQGIVQ